MARFPAASFDEVEQLARPEIEAMQFERLQWTIKHAYENVPLYTRKFDEVGVKPADIRTLADVAKLPFTEMMDSAPAPA